MEDSRAILDEMRELRRDLSKLVSILEWWMMIENQVDEVIEKDGVGRNMSDLYTSAPSTN